MIDLKNHPIEVFFDDPRLRGAMLEFSIYKYVPQVLDDDRDIFSVSYEDLTYEWLSNTLGSLGSGYDLAVHSLFRKNGKIKYFPFIDMACELSELEQAYWRLKSILPPKYMRESFFVKSGRSYHVYIMRPVDRKEWIEFMGRILLTNFPGESIFVDQRWVGHRIMAGYGALRWSNNNPKYVGYPEIIRSAERFFGRADA